jgi:hypothetical protein
MNEQEAIEQLKGEYLATNGAETPARVRYHNEALDTAIAALNEVQEYHATGRTPSMVRALQTAYIRAKKRLDKYIAIGTPEQCIEAIYKQMRLPVNNQEGDSYYFLTGDCPVCGFRMIARANYCINCGQRLSYKYASATEIVNDIIRAKRMERTNEQEQSK